MAGATSNLPEVEAIFDSLAHCLDFDRPAPRGHTFGDNAFDVIAAGIQQRTLVNQQASDGSPLAANRGDYGVSKRSQGIEVGVGLYPGGQVGGDMLEFQQIRGQTTATANEASMTYGLDEETRLKAEYFQDTTRSVQPKRPFYDLDKNIESSLDVLTDETIDAAIRDLGGY